MQRSNRAAVARHSHIADKGAVDDGCRNAKGSYVCSETPAHTGIKAMFKGLLHDFGNLPSKEFCLAGVGGGLAFAAHPADDRANDHLVGKGWAKNVFTPGSVMGNGLTLFGAAATVYAVG